MKMFPRKVLTAITVLVFCNAFSSRVSGEEGPPVHSAAHVRQAGQTPERISLAERYLFRLSEKSRKARRLVGWTGLGVGAVGIVGGLVMLSENEEDDWLGLAELSGAIMVSAGAISALGGAISLAVVSPSERAYKRIRPIQDPAMREQACADALASLAKKARTWRMIAGGFGCAAAAAGAVLAAKEDASGYTVMAVSAGAGALYSFLVKSSAERAYRAYLEQSPVKTIPDLILGFGPRGGFRVGLTMDF
jgi:hypothetical protein